MIEKLRAIAKGDYARPTGTEKRKFGNIVYAAVTLPVTEIRTQLDKASTPIGFYSEILLRFAA